uniref:Transmembrane protein n=1 Tax=Plectus sambesii TaxID=2011161 RepID=A0A914UJF6_9BILA
MCAARRHALFMSVTSAHGGVVIGGRRRRRWIAEEEEEEGARQSAKRLVVPSLYSLTSRCFDRDQLRRRSLALLFGWMLVIIVLVRHHWLEWVTDCCCWWKRRRPPSISTALSRDGSLRNHNPVSRQNSGISEGRARSTSRGSRKSHRLVSEKHSAGQQSFGSRRSRKDTGDRGDEEHAPVVPVVVVEPDAQPTSPPTKPLVCLSPTYQTPV